MEKFGMPSTAEHHGGPINGKWVCVCCRYGYEWAGAGAWFRDRRDGDYWLCIHCQPEADEPRS